MKVRVVFSTSVIFFISLLVAGGCVSKSQYDQCVRRNKIQFDRIQELESQLAAGNLDAKQWQDKYNLLQQENNSLQEKINLLQAALKEKGDIIARLTEQLSQPALPLELSNALADWARSTGSDLVSFDEKRGIVQFKSDLLFEKGEDTVQAEAVKQLELLANILNSDAAAGFDILIVGHTDDIRIIKPETLSKHPTNWYLSAHRAIAVEKILASKVNETRMSVMGMGEFRPLEPNLPNKGGNPKNRRVDIYIVPAGQIRISNSPSAAQTAP